MQYLNFEIVTQSVININFEYFLWKFLELFLFYVEYLVCKFLFYSIKTIFKPQMDYHKIFDKTFIGFMSAKIKKKLSY